MPRDQETSFRNDPTASDDPLFREPSDRFRDGQVPGDQDQGDRDLADPNDTGATPIGDELTGRHAGPADADEVTLANGTASGPVTDTPGEWVAGAKGPDYASGAGTDTGTRVGTDTGTRVGSDFDAPLGADVRDGHDTETPLGTDVRDGHDTDTPVDTDPLVPASTSSPATGVTKAPEGTEPASATGAPAASGTPFATEDSATAPAAPADTPITTGGATAVTDVPATTEAPVTTETPSAADVPATAGAPATAATPATPVPGAPGTAETPGVNTGSFVTNGDELHADWARIQSSFVDDPRGSVSQAADLVSQVTSSLVAAVQEREQALRGEWESQEGTDTEHLRNALRDYRAYFELLVKL
jgi:hypothetical protein